MLLGKIFKSRDPGNRQSVFWMEAIAEFVLVVVGILLALQIQNWNQGRQDRKLERTILEEMRMNLQDDLKDVRYNLKAEQDNLESTRIVMDYLNSDGPYHDSMSFHLARMIEGTIFVANTSAFESIESIGINLIRNDSLRQQITYLYSANYAFIRKLEDFFNQSSLIELYPQLARHVRQVDPHRAVPLDPSGIKGSNELYSALVNNAQFLNYQIKAYGTAERLILELISNIEKELNQ